MSIEGRIWKYGDDVNTDLIIPGKYLDNYDPRHLASHAMEGLDPEFAESAAEGDIILAGRNFGCGSSREQAVIALKTKGVSGVVAVSFARIFYRNAVNLGLYAVTSKNAVSMFQSGDRAVWNPASMTIASPNGSVRAELDEIPSHVRQILAAGGLVPYLKQKLARENSR